MAIGSLLQVSQLLITKWWRALFLLMLVLLHVAAMRGPEDAWARGLMLAHFGLFIMWQPFMQAERRLTPSQALAIVAIGLGILYFLNGWLLALWVSVFAGIVGGKVFLFQARWLRRFYLVVLLYLTSLLLIWIVPTSFITVPLPDEVQVLAHYGFPVLFLVMLAIPAEADVAETPQIVDFFYAALIFLLLLFSPQSNSRHYAMLVLGNCLATLLLLHAQSTTPKWPLAAGVLVLFLGTILPPGARPAPLAQRVWNYSGGISWCALVLLATLIWFVVEEVRFLRQRSAGAASTPETSKSKLAA